MKTATNPIIILLLLIMQTACISAGTHGSIKAYEYPVSKAILQKAVDVVIAQNSDIHMPDTSKKGYVVDITNGTPDTLFDDSPNADAYVSLIITRGASEIDYTFQYVGSTDDWATSKTSTISIAYAYDEKSNGGSEGNGGFPWYRPSLKKKMTGLFEEELINKIDKELGLTHIETD